MFGAQVLYRLCNGYHLQQLLLRLGLGKKGVSLCLFKSHIYNEKRDARPFQRGFGPVRVADADVCE